MSTPIIPSPAVDWKTIIGRHEYVALHAIATRDLSVIDAGIARSASALGDHARALIALTESKDHIENIKAINIKTAEAFREAIEIYKAAIEKHKKEDENTKEGWMTMWDDQQNKAIDSMTTRIKEATVKAKEVIQVLPEVARLVAANCFVDGSNWAMKAYKVLSDAISKDFPESNLEAVTQAFGTVNLTVTTVTNAIDGWFSGFDPDLPSNKVRPNPRKYTGRWNRPAENTMAENLKDISHVTDYLIKEDVRILCLTLSKESDGKETVLEMVIEHKDDGPSTKNLEENSNKLSEIWKNAVADAIIICSSCKGTGRLISSNTVDA